MEDPERDMAETEWEIPPVKKTSHDEDRLTIMIIRSLGRVRSFKISPHLVFWGTLFFILYIPISVVIINNYIALYHTSKTQSNKIEVLEKEIIKSQKNLHRFQQHVTLLEDYIRHLEEPKTAGTSSNRSQPLEQGSVASHPNGMARDSEEEKEPPGVVDIKDMIIQKEGSRMTVDFKLFNMNPGETAVGGYIHMIALGDDPNPPPEWTFPRVTLEEGIPINFRRGQLFLIQRFKSVQGRFYLVHNAQPPKALKVMVYDQSGVLILEKQFEVSHAS